MGSPVAGALGGLSPQMYDMPVIRSSKISHFGLFYKGKFETEARILAMRLALRVPTPKS